MQSGEDDRLTPVLFDQADARSRGEAHGELWRSQIRELAEIRTDLAVRRAFGDRQMCLQVAALHLPVLETHAPELHEELLGIARGSGLSPETIVVLNHYTDLRDVPPSVLAEHEPDGCTAIYLPGDVGGILGQTWDMHTSAQPHVRIMKIAPRGSDEQTLCFTLTGCLGMAGLGPHGVGVTINNLSSTDGQVGLVWPALVRTLLAAESAKAAYQRLLEAPLSSGHHYMIADGAEFYGVECSGKLKVLTQQGAKAAHVHTNHCFDPVLRKHENVSLRSTTFERMNLATTLYVQQRPTRLEHLWALLGSHDGAVGICVHANPGDADASSTCGALAMELRTGRVRFSTGCLRGPFAEIALPRSASRER